MGIDLAVEDYPGVVSKLPKNTDKLDIAVDKGGGTFESEQMDFAIADLEMRIAFALGVDMGPTPTAEVEMTWNATAVNVTPTYVRIKHRSGGIKALSDIRIQIGSASGLSDILPPTTLTGYSVDGNYTIFIWGPTPQMLESVNKFFLQILVGAQNDPQTSDVILYGTNEDE